MGALSIGAASTIVGAAGTASASSHREAPLIAGDPQADNTDTYAFVSPDKPNMVTFVANWYPFQEPNGGPNFYPFANHAHYNIKVDNNGDGKADVTYQWAFRNHYRAKSTFLYNTGVVSGPRDKDLNFRQTYTLTEIDGSGANPKTHVLIKKGAVAPSFTGKASMPHYGKIRHKSIYKVGTRGKSYAGPADDPFFLDLRVFDLLYGTDLSEAGHDTLNGYNVNTIALQVPIKKVTQNHKPHRNPVIGTWSTTDRQAATVRTAGGQKTTGQYVQVSRLGNPLVNEVVVPIKYKDAFNGLAPDADHTVTPVVNKVLNPILPKLIQAVYGIKAPKTPRNDLAEIFLYGICKKDCGPIHAQLNSQIVNKGVTRKQFVPAEELRLNTAVKPSGDPNRLGVLGGDFQGFPNGRRLTDDIVDIEVQAVEGAARSGHLVKALAAGDGVNVNDKQFGKHFPYVALPHQRGVSHASNGSQNAAVGGPSGGNGGGFSLPETIAVSTAAALLGLVLAGLGIARLRRPTSQAAL
jgi:hypothetical protein